MIFRAFVNLILVNKLNRPHERDGFTLEVYHLLFNKPSRCLYKVGKFLFCPMYMTDPLPYMSNLEFAIFGSA